METPCSTSTKAHNNPPGPPGGHYTEEEGMMMLKIKVHPLAVPEEVIGVSLIRCRDKFSVADEGWYEDYGIITVLLDGDDTTSAVEQDLNDNPEVLQWWIE